MIILLHTVYKIFNKQGIQHTYIILFIFIIITKIECLPVFKQEPSDVKYGSVAHFYTMAEEINMDY